MTLQNSAYHVQSASFLLCSGPGWDPEGTRLGPGSTGSAYRRSHFGTLRHTVLCPMNAMPRPHERCRRAGWSPAARRVPMSPRLTSVGHSCGPWSRLGPARVPPGSRPGPARVPTGSRHGPTVTSPGQNALPRICLPPEVSVQSRAAHTRPAQTFKTSDVLNPSPALRHSSCLEPRLLKTGFKTTPRDVPGTSRDGPGTLYRVPANPVF